MPETRSITCSTTEWMILSLCLCLSFTWFCYCTPKHLCFDAFTHRPMAYSKIGSRAGVHPRSLYMATYMAKHGNFHPNHCNVGRSPGHKKRSVLPSKLGISALFGTPLEGSIAAKPSCLRDAVRQKIFLACMALRRCHELEGRLAKALPSKSGFVRGVSCQTTAIVF